MSILSHLSQIQVFKQFWALTRSALQDFILGVFYRRTVCVRVRLSLYTGRSYLLCPSWHAECLYACGNKS